MDGNENISRKAVFLFTTGLKKGEKIYGGYQIGTHSKYIIAPFFREKSVISHKIPPIKNKNDYPLYAELMAFSTACKEISKSYPRNSLVVVYCKSSRIVEWGNKKFIPESSVEKEFKNCLNSLKEKRNVVFEFKKRTADKVYFDELESHVQSVADSEFAKIEKQKKKGKNV